jgi:hypothetical protein
MTELHRSIKRYCSLAPTRYHLLTAGTDDDVISRVEFGVLVIHATWSVPSNETVISLCLMLGRTEFEEIPIFFVDADQVQMSQDFISKYKIGGCGDSFWRKDGATIGYLGRAQVHDLELAESFATALVRGSVRCGNLSE